MAKSKKPKIPTDFEIWNAWRQTELCKSAEKLKQSVKEIDIPQIALYECRLLFLRAAAIHPQIRIWDSLRKKVSEPIRRGRTAVGEWTDELTHQRARLIASWMADHNLSHEWVLSMAFDQVVCWPLPKEPFAIFPGYPTPRFVWREWCFGHETETAYKKLIRVEFRKALDAYIGEVKRRRLRLLDDRGSQNAHYRWAVEHVCLGWGWSKIANKNGYSVTEQAVRKAVLEILKRIEIPYKNNSTRAKKPAS